MLDATLKTQRVKRSISDMDTYHLVPEGQLWKLRKEGADRAAFTFNHKTAAVDCSTEFVRRCGGALRIHKEDGTFEEERTYPRATGLGLSPG